MRIIHDIVELKTGKTIKRIEHDYDYFLVQVATGHPAFGIKSREYLRDMFGIPVFLQRIGCK